MSASPPPSPLNYARPQRNDLRDIARRQRAIMLCILAEIVLIICYVVLPDPLKLFARIAIFAAQITAMVFVFMLAIAIYNTGVGIVLGILTLIPLIGLIVLLIVNGKATNILRQHGIKVGLMGADMSQVPDTHIS